MNRSRLLTVADLAKLPTRAERRRHRFMDAAVYDQAAVCRSIMDGRPVEDAMRARFMDDATAFFRNELDKLDPNLVEPLSSTTWSDDIDTLDVQMGEKSTSFIRTKIGAVGTQKVGGLPWLDQNSNTLPNVSVSGELLTKPLRPLGMEIVVDEFEMAGSVLLGRKSVEQQKSDALNIIYQEGIDQMVYQGDTTVGAKGLVNQPDTLIATDDVANGDWLNPATSPANIVADMQEALRQAWENTDFKIAPTDMLLPPAHWAMIHTRQMTNINETIASWFIRTSLSSQRNRKPINIRPVHQLTTAGVDGTPRMLVYSRRRDYVRFPMMSIKRFATYHQALAFHAPYAWVFGEVEIPRPEFMSYWDNLGVVAA